MGSPRLKESHTDMAMHGLEQAVLGGRTNVVLYIAAVPSSGVVLLLPRKRSERWCRHAYENLGNPHPTPHVKHTFNDARQVLPYATRTAHTYMDNQSPNHRVIAESRSRQIFSHLPLAGVP